MTRCARAVQPVFCLVLLLGAGRAFAHIEQEFACFVYIEPFEVRVEFVTTTASLGMPLSFGFDGIDTYEQAALVGEAGLHLAEVFEIRADDKALGFEPDHVGFVRVESEGIPIVPDERDLIPIHEARISGIFVCRREGLPRSVDVRLKLFEGRLYRPPDVIPVEIEVLTSSARRESAKFEFTEDKPRQSWVLPSGMAGASLADIAAPPPPSYVLLYVAGALGIGGAAICISPFWKSRPRVALGFAVLIVGIGFSGISLQRGFATPIEEDQAESAIGALLTNIYYAFAYRDESRVFDTLAASVDGPLLEELYLDIRRGLSDAEGGGPSVRVLGVELLDCEIEESSSERLHARVRWVSSGTVSHWGHAHERRNRYRAEVVAEPVGDRWKLTRVTILEEERVE